ncbi:MAG: CPBP family intramembrane metalloprotease [Clostridiales bacterium]|jgi:membrane protease YdiL (CAAX protease family)|nr:CPBP family intramembrane metalloprotease [Clostridiales bacterium]
MTGTKRKDVVTIVITFIFVLAVAYGIGWFNGNVLPNFSGVLHLILMTVVWWPMLIATVFFMRRDKERAKDIGFTKEKVLYQILIGALVAVGSLLIFIVLPALFSFQMGIVGNFDFFNLVNLLLAVALIEEIIFRGHLFKKLFDINGSKWFAIIVSSVLFGLFHIFNWNLAQIVFTTIMGIYWCICRDKIKHCTLLSLIIGHALHNAFHPAITALFFGG